MTQIKQEWQNIRVSPEMRFWLMSEKARRQLLTYDQVLRELKEEQQNARLNEN